MPTNDAPLRGVETAAGRALWRSQHSTPKPPPRAELAAEGPARFSFRRIDWAALLKRVYDPMRSPAHVGVAYASLLSFSNARSRKPSFEASACPPIVRGARSAEGSDESAHARAENGAFVRWQSGEPNDSSTVTSDPSDPPSETCSGDCRDIVDVRGSFSTGRRGRGSPRSLETARFGGAT